MRISDWSSDVCSSDLFGCAHMLRQGPKPDYAVIAKSGWSVSWDEVGFAWYEVNVAGAHSYVGSRHLLPYSNAIANAGKVVADLEEWLPIWMETHRSGLVAPQGEVSFIESGCRRMPAFTPAARSETRRVGKEFVSRSRSRWWPYH